MRPPDSTCWRRCACSSTASQHLRDGPPAGHQPGAERELRALAQTRPREFADLLAPLNRLVGEILERGTSEGVVSGELNTEAAAAVVLQTIFGARRIRALGTELAGMHLDNDLQDAFCLHGLAGAA